MAELVLKLPPLLAREVEVIGETGFYKDESEFVAAALRTLLAARPDVRIAVAVKLYERGDISIGRACEISGLDIESMKEELHRRGVRRPTAEDVSEVIAMAEAARRLAGR